MVGGPIKESQLYSTIKKFRVALAPLRFGAGLKTKILDGWQVGLPCVTTSIGAEGLMEWDWEHKSAQITDLQNEGISRYKDFGGLVQNDCEK